MTRNYTFSSLLCSLRLSYCTLKLSKISTNELNIDRNYADCECYKAIYRNHFSLFSSAAVAEQAMQALVYSQQRCLSVRPSVTLLISYQNEHHFFTGGEPEDYSFLPYQVHPKIQNDHPSEVRALHETGA